MLIFSCFVDCRCPSALIWRLRGIVLYNANKGNMISSNGKIFGWKLRLFIRWPWIYRMLMAKGMCAWGEGRRFGVSAFHFFLLSSSFWEKSFIFIYKYKDIFWFLREKIYWNAETLKRLIIRCLNSVKWIKIVD